MQYAASSGAIKRAHVREHATWHISEATRIWYVISRYRASAIRTIEIRSNRSLKQRKTGEVVPSVRGHSPLMVNCPGCVKDFAVIYVMLLGNADRANRSGLTREMGHDASAVSTIDRKSLTTRGALAKGYRARWRTAVRRNLIKFDVQLGINPDTRERPVLHFAVSLFPPLSLSRARTVRNFGECAQERAVRLGVIGTTD